MAGSLALVMYWAVRTTLCSVVGSRTVAIPGGDATCQGTLDVAAVEPFEELRTNGKSFQSPEGE